MRKTNLLCAGACLAALMPEAAIAREYRIEAQGVATALQQFGMQSDKSVVYRLAEVAEKRSRSVRGELREEEALKRLLDGTSLSYQKISTGYVVERQQATPKVGANGAPDLQIRRNQNVRTTAPEVATGSYEDIIVTARRVEEKLQDIPLSVSALSGDMLKEQAIRDIRDLSSSVPNLIIQQGNADAHSAVVSIRGQNQSSVLLSTDGSVGVYMDNVNIPRAYGLRAALMDIQRVEVLRGPQGTLYGRNTTGGAVSIITQDPKNELGGSIQLTAGNYSAANATAVLNLPLGDGVGLRLAGQYDYHKGYGTAPMSPGADPQRSDGFYVRGKLKFDRGAFRATLTGDAFDFRTGGVITRLTGLVNGAIPNVPGVVTPTTANPTGRGPLTILGGLPVQEVQIQEGLPFTVAGLQEASRILQSFVNKGDFYTTFGGSTIAGRSKGRAAMLNADYDLSDAITLRSISGYRYVERLSPADNDGTPYVLNASNGGVKDNFYSQEVQVLGGDERLNWVLGAFYSYEDGTETASPRTLYLRSNRNQVLTDVDVVNKSYAFFGQGNFTILDGLVLTLGARWTKETKRIVIRSGSIPFGGSFTCQITGDAAALLLDRPGVCAATLENSYSDPSWLASVNYAINEDVNVYAKFATGFRGGGQQLRAAGSNPATYTPFRPESITEYEVGFKSELFDRRLRLNLAAFWDDYTDVQKSILFLVNGSSVTAVQNAAKARIWGFEGETTLRVTDNFTLDGSVGYINPKYIDFKDFSGPGATLRDRAGEAWPAPDWNFRIGGRYTVPTAIGDATISLNYNWQSKNNLSPTSLASDQVTQKAYGLLNGRASLAIEEWNADVAIFGRNLLGTKYYTTGIGFEALSFNTLQSGDPRVLGIQFIKRFGGE